jgi:hypothetical protein
MNRFPVWLPVCLAVVACRGSQPTARTGVEATPTPPSAATAPATPGTDGDTLAPPEAVDPAVVTIKPTGRPGWTPEKPKLAVLGEAMDEAAKGLRETLAEVETVYAVAGGKMNARLEFRIRDKDTYKVEWVEPETGPQINSIVRNGSQAAVRLAGVQSRPKAFPAAAPKPSTADAWIENPLRMIVRPYESGVFGWEGLLADLERPGAGFTVETESSEPTVAGKKRKLLRVVARKKSGETLELVVDDARKLPLTVRVNRPGAAGDDRILWTARWGTGGSHDESAFAMPKVP